MAAETTTGFEIDGTVYEVPTLSTFTLDEAQVLYDYCGLTVEDILMASDEDQQFSERLRNPSFKRALVHIAYQRGNPTADVATVKALAGTANFMHALDALLDLSRAEEGDAVPPELTSEPAGSSPTSSLENEKSTLPKDDSPGNGSAQSSAAPVGQPKRITV